MNNKKEKSFSPWVYTTYKCNCLCPYCMVPITDSDRSTMTLETWQKFLNKIDKLLIDGKDFGFNSEASSSKNYSLFDNVIYVNNSEITNHYNKHLKLTIHLY